VAIDHGLDVVRHALPGWQVRHRLNPDHMWFVMLTYFTTSYSLKESTSASGFSCASTWPDFSDW